MISIRNVAFTYSTLSITVGSTRSCATRTITPVARDCGVSYGVVVGVVHSDGHSGVPIPSLTSACPI